MFYKGHLYIRIDNNQIKELVYPTSDWDNSHGFPHISIAHDSGYGTQVSISSERTFSGTPNGYRSPNSGNFIRFEKATDAQVLVLLINWNTTNKAVVEKWVDEVKQRCSDLSDSEKERLTKLSRLTETEKTQVLANEWEKLFQQKRYEEAINISKELVTLDGKSYLARLNFGIAKIEYAINDCKDSDYQRNFYFGSAVDDFELAFDLVEKLPKEAYKKLGGEKIKATCCYYMGVARSRNLMEYPGPIAMINALGNLDESLKYYDDVKVREYRRKADNFNRSN